MVERAIRFRSRGVVAVDIAGPRPRGGGPPYPYRELAPLVARARDAGLGVTRFPARQRNAPDPRDVEEEMREGVVDRGRGRPGRHGTDRRDEARARPCCSRAG